MKSLGKLLALALALLVLVCVAAGLTLGFTDKGRGILRFSTGLADIIKTSKGAESLARKFPFTPPPNGNVPEERLLVYIAVCNEVLPSVKSYEKWIEAHQGQKGDFNDAQEVINLTSEVLKGASQSFEKNKMGPAEFGWIGRAMEKAALDQVSGGTRLEREILESYSRVLGFSGLSDEERARVSADIEKFRSQMGEAGAPPSPNGELYRKHAADLAACALSGEGRQLLQGLGEGSAHVRSKKMEAEKTSKED